MARVPHRRAAEPPGFWFTLAALVLRPPLTAAASREWAGAENIPASGGVLLCTNHISYLDPLTFAHFVYDRGRLPRILAKQTLWDVPLLGRVLDATGQIPVARESGDAASAYDAAVAAVRAGRAVVIYPEGTITRDPQLWPMAGKTGAARVALATGAPVIPVAQWGVADILAPYARRPRLWPRARVVVHAGPPVDLSRFAGLEPTERVLREATEEILDAITSLLAEIRAEPAPRQRYDPRTTGVARTGNPSRPDGVWFVRMWRAVHHPGRPRGPRHPPHPPKA